MKALEDKILAEGTVLPGNILKVGSFLNHQIDPDIVMQMGEEIARLFKDCGVNKILTIETSGIPVAFAAAHVMQVPLVFAKKNKTGNVSGGVYSAVVHSYTHGTDYTVIVSNEYLSANDKILIVDDVFTTGSTLNAAIDLIKQGQPKNIKVLVLSKTIYKTLNGR
jgi:xanthine phosphoribosyltransferase